MTHNLEKILYMATSVNGTIARDDDRTDFVSDDEWEKGYIEATRQFSNIIIGQKTYEIMLKDDSFAHLSDDLFVVIVSNENREQPKNPNHTYVASPSSALQKVEEKGFNTTLIAGGTLLNTAFLEQNLIDKVIIDIEPVLIGKGKNLYNSSTADIDLQFEKIENLTKNLIQLHYSVKK